MAKRTAEALPRPSTGMAADGAQPAAAGDGHPASELRHVSAGDAPASRLAGADEIGTMLEQWLAENAGGCIFAGARPAVPIVHAMLSLYRLHRCWQLLASSKFLKCGAPADAALDFVKDRCPKQPDETVEHAGAQISASMQFSAYACASQHPGIRILHTWRKGGCCRCLQSGGSHRILATSSC